LTGEGRSPVLRYKSNCSKGEIFYVKREMPMLLKLNVHPLHYKKGAGVAQTA
jgi:hypothetical protein